MADSIVADPAARPWVRSFARIHCLRDMAVFLRAWAAPSPSVCLAFNASAWHIKVSKPRIVLRFSSDFSRYICLDLVKQADRRLHRFQMAVATFVFFSSAAVYRCILLHLWGNVCHLLQTIKRQSGIWISKLHAGKVQKSHRMLSYREFFVFKSSSPKLSLKSSNLRQLFALMPGTSTWRKNAGTYNSMASQHIRHTRRGYIMLRHFLRQDCVLQSNSKILLLKTSICVENLQTFFCHG